MNKGVRTKVIIGNWKMNKTIAEARAFVAGLAAAANNSKCIVGLAVPFTAIAACAQSAKETPIAIGAQNVSQAEEGAFTGEISSIMLKEAGAAFAIVGHSERRRYFHEDDRQVNSKAMRLLSVGLQPVVCIGETLDEHESGLTKEVLSRHLKQSLMEMTPREVSSLIVAYEPVWAIGTGRAASPDDVQAVHAYCRSVVHQIWGGEAASKISILYGGSVTLANADAIAAQPDVDGLLIGGASLSLESFCGIVEKF